MRELRQERGLSQAKLAQKLRRAGVNLDPSAITRIEKNADTTEGARSIFLGEAAVIARALGVRLPEMLRETGTPVEKFEEAAIGVMRTTSFLESVQRSLTSARAEAKTVQQQYELSLQLLDEDDQGDPKVQLLRRQVERYKTHEQLRARRDGLADYLTYLREQEGALEEEIARRDPETEVYTVRDRRDRLESVRTRIRTTTAEIRMIDDDLATLQAADRHDAADEAEAEAD